MTCDREFLAGAVAAGPFWVLAVFAALAGFWLITERLHRRRKRNEQAAAHLHHLFLIRNRNESDND